MASRIGRAFSCARFQLLVAKDSAARGCSAGGDVGKKESSRRSLARINRLTRRKISDAITACSAELGFNENDSRALARCLAANLKGDGKAKLFLDITELARVDGKSGFQRVVRALLLALSRGMPHGYAVKPVIFDGQHFRHANRFSSWFLGCDTAADHLIDPASGDQYLSLDLNVASISSSSPKLESLRRKGVKLNFLVYDILPIQHLSGGQQVLQMDLQLGSMCIGCQTD